MARLRPGWLVVLCAGVLAVSVWLPWLTSRADGGGRASAIGGIVGTMPVPPPGFGVGQLIVLLASSLIVAGAMAARGLFGRVASSAALAISVLLVVLTMWYYRLYVYSPVSAGYGLYLGAVAAALAMVLSVWAMFAAWSVVGRG
jgi:fucose 4-O-acetylase-like acetyltransferase